MSPGLVAMLVALAVTGASLVAGERGGGGTRRLAVVATIGAAAGAGRILFAPIPSVQPVTVICLVAGATLGLRAGLMVGPIAVLVSNGFLGHGPWTPAQMALWALVGASGALLGQAARRRAVLAAAGAVWGIVFGWAMNVWFLAVFGPELNLPAMVLSGARSLPFDLAHAAGNVVIALAIGPALHRLLARYAARTQVRILPAPAPVSPPG